MENKRQTTALFATLALASLIYIRIMFGNGNKMVEYASDVFIVIYLLAFAPQVLLLIFASPFRIYQKIQLSTSSNASKTQTILNNTSAK